MAQNQNLGKNSNPTKGYHGYFWLQAITRQQIELESCSNPLQMGKVL